MLDCESEASATMSDELELQPLGEESTIIVKPGGDGSNSAAAGQEQSPAPQIPQTAPPKPPPGAATEPEPAGPVIDSPYTIEELDVFGILAQSFAIIKRRWPTLLGITAVVVVPVKAFFALAIFVLAMIPALRPALSPDAAATQALTLIAIFLVGVTVYAVIMVGFAYPLVNGATLNAIAMEYLGVPASVFESINAALPRVVPILWTSFLGALLAGLGCILLIIPGIYLLFRFWFAVPCVMLENRSGWAALKRSGQLMESNYGTLIGLIIMIIIAFTIGHGAADKIEQPILQLMAEAAADSVVGLFSAAATMVFYFSSRFRLEQFDLAALAKEMKYEPVISSAAPQ